MSSPWIPKQFIKAAAFLVLSGASHCSLAQTDGTQARPPFVLEFGTTAINVASPLVTSDGTVYVGTRHTIAGSPSVDNGRVWAISANGSSRSFVTGDWVDATPVIGPDGTLYVGAWNGNLYALRDTGTAIEKIWEYQTGAYIYSSAAIGPDGTIYVGAGDSNLHAVNANGTLKWKFPASDWVDSSPAVAPNANVIFGSWDGRVYAVGPNGDEKWRFSTGGAVLGSPAIAPDGTVYVGSIDNYLYALNPDGSKKWDYQTGADIESSPAIGSDGRIYVGSNDGYVYSINPDGLLAWRTQVGASVASSPALRADGTLVVGVTAVAGTTAQGQLVCVRLSDGFIKWRFETAQSSTGVQLPLDIVDSSPAIGSDNRIYFTDYNRRLYTLNGTSGLATTGWPKWRRDVTHKARMPNDGTLGQLANLSTRARVGTGDDIVIAGTFIAGGSGKSLLVRGVGPELAGFNVSGVLDDPVLEVFDSGENLILQNDTWDPSLQTTFSQLGAFALNPGSLSAALLANFPAGNSFTFQARGKNDTNGVAIVEVYDAQRSSGRLTNLSSRAVVGTGDDRMIPGFILHGTGPSTLLIRVVGPTLASFNVPAVLARPAMTLVRDGVPVVTNQVWGNAPNAAFIKDVTPLVGAFPLPDGSADSAVLVTLNPGSYTVVVSGVNETTGVVLVELYVVNGY